MMRSLLLVVVLAVLAVSTQAFAPSPSFGVRTAAPSTTELEACRANAKKEKRQRNRENMRKFQRKRGTSRKKAMKKIQSNEARQKEAEFLAKCFTSVPPPEGNASQ
uniref:BZIP domain-containing protein n=1 Tax=Trieres chinensis TaxID=1514140 RepID=A0A7S2A5Y1_TRICV|mmetsp:Transcript_4531/g.9573  ORF Transcript_4531/g.9573 Transcript_4531/m.9573 type:complete len:106 (+) Transcript_4531:141-458(+)|eukprot:CAMPEP_0183290550 /NCGR_PEP_ID=MMETSP0160_2-20130417/176_1 /TAXON_ID=2839 ORGANISM="Odontella Sinensis, Strain Grunow 1884" /NCGR_SAMPLE_ID=MMETSP0160_2 /ASSEMBLY_ACC=CAM_ASM_000250 /LENGTH=105 /DNA_ID=CAMNT_0025451173 /DNA_START=140 /DNA_END=457 /DNA_ORIENTATION=-